MKSLSWLFLLSVVSGVCLAEIDPEIKERCTAKWHADYRMLKYCVDRQLEGKGRLARYLDGVGGSDFGKEIIVQCYREWRDEFGLDYVMAVYCIRTQLEALEELKNY